MVTAYDYPSAVHVARAGMDMILVGDSVAMVELGHATTQPMTVDQMMHHCQAVRRGIDFAVSDTTSRVRQITHHPRNVRHRHLRPRDRRHLSIPAMLSPHARQLALSATRLPCR